LLAHILLRLTLRNTSQFQVVSDPVNSVFCDLRKQNAEYLEKSDRADKAGDSDCQLSLKDYNPRLLLCMSGMSYA